MNTDRELLELAAKAAEIQIQWHRWPSTARETAYVPNGDFSEQHGVCYSPWNPLTDDGDALRLAARLYLDINQFPATDGYVGMVEIWRNGDGDPAHVEYVKVGDDRLIATRRAIVCVAAEIGRNMK